MKTLEVILFDLLRVLQRRDKEKKTNMVARIDYANTINEFIANFQFAGEHFGIYTLNDYFRDMGDEPLPRNCINGYNIYILVTDKEILSHECGIRNSKFIFYGWIEDENGEYLCGII